MYSTLNSKFSTRISAEFIVDFFIIKLYDFEYSSEFRSRIHRKTENTFVGCH